MRAYQGTDSDTMYDIVHKAHCFLCRESNATLPLSTINNGTLFAHIFVGPDSLLPDQARNYGRFKVITVPLTKYLPPSKTEFNLVTGEYEV